MRLRRFIVPTVALYIYTEDAAHTNIKAVLIPPGLPHRFRCTDAQCDARYEVDDLLAEGDRVVVRWRVKGTYQNAFPGIDTPPAGQAITLKGVAIYQVEKGKLA